MLRRSPDTRFLDWKVQNTEHHLKKLIEILPWQQFKSTKRMVCSLGKSYPYSGHITVGHSFDYYPPLKALMDKLNTELGTNFNSVLLNWYPANTYVGIGKHSDNEKELIANQPVASVSLGCTTDFILESSQKGEKKEHVVVQLTDGDVFVMGKACQNFYLHSCPYKQMELDRISMTFREFK